MSRGSTRLIAAASVVAAVGALAGCDGSTGPVRTPAPQPASSTAPGTVTRSPSPSPTPSVTLPPSVASRLPSLGSLPAGADPCATARSAFTAASTYVALAQLGQSALARRCVQGSAVAPSVTAGLRAASVAQYFAPAGPTDGATIAFRRVDGTATVRVTTARSGSRFAVTSVTTG